jgi:hypothetical protein
MTTATLITSSTFREVVYIVAFSCFVYGLSELTGPKTAVRGNRVAAVGMLIAIVGTLLRPQVDHWALIALGLVAGTAVGIPAARKVKMTAMPQMVALFNGVGGGAVALIAWVEFRSSAGFTADPTYVALFTTFAAIVGSISFWGSAIAFAKLQELMTGNPVTLGRWQTPLNALVAAIAVGCGARQPSASWSRMTITCSSAGQSSRTAAILASWAASSHTTTRVSECSARSGTPRASWCGRSARRSRRRRARRNPRASTPDRWSRAATRSPGPMPSARSPLRTKRGTRVALDGREQHLTTVAGDAGRSTECASNRVERADMQSGLRARVKHPRAPAARLGIVRMRHSRAA